MHVVHHGETLHAIARRYDVDIKDLARWNRIRDPDYIVAGQLLYIGAIGDSSRSERTPAPQHSSSPSLQSGASQKNSDWIWPIPGRVIARFGAGEEFALQGVEIEGPSGAPVRAAATGQVVYSGTGLLYYNHVIIIRHNSDYLTIYGYNRNIAVNEGDTIYQGQIIAELDGSEKLYFEMRKGKTTVNPETYLPRR